MYISSYVFWLICILFSKIYYYFTKLFISTFIIYTILLACDELFGIDSEIVY